MFSQNPVVCPITHLESLSPNEHKIIADHCLPCKEPSFSICISIIDSFIIIQKHTIDMLQVRAETA